MATHATVPVSVVGNSFVIRYYTVLNSSPDLLHHFYQEQSICCHGTEGQVSEPVTGMKNIHVKLSSSFPEKGSTVTLSVVDIQESLEGSVIVMVIGSMNTPGRASKRFVQSFVLAKQQPEGFYVRNDMLRYVSEPEDKTEPAAPSTTGPASSAPYVVPEQRKQEAHAQKPVEQAPAPSTAPAPTSAPAPTAQPASTQAHPAPTPAPKEPAPAPSQPQQPQTQAPKETQAPAAKEPQQQAPEKPHAQPEKAAQPQQAPAPAPAPTPAPAQTPAQAPAAPAKENVPQTQAPAAAAPKETAPAKQAEKPAAPAAEKPAAAAEKPVEKPNEKPAAPKVFSWASVAAAAASNPAPVTMPPPPKKDAQAKPAANAAAPAATTATTPAAQSPAQTHNQQPAAGANSKPQKTKAEFEADSTWVYVNNLPYTTTLENVVKHFGTFGAIKFTESHIPKGYAFLKYETKEIASSVIESAKKVPVNMEGRHVTVDWRQTKPVKDRRNKPDKADRPHKPKPFTNGANGSPKDHPRKPKDKPQHPTNNTTTAQPSPKPTPAKDHQ